MKCLFELLEKFFARSGPILIKKLFKPFTISFLFVINLLSITKLLGNVLPVELPATFLNIFHISIMFFLYAM